MKKYILLIFTVSFILIFTCNAHAVKYYSNRLLIEKGKSEIVMTSGEKKRLHVSSSLTGLPVFKDLHFSSSNILIATVDRSGVVRAGMRGRAHITVVDKKGRVDSILIVVEGSKKTGFIGIIIILIILISAVVFLKKTCCRKK